MAGRRAEVYWKGRLEEESGSSTLGDWMMGEPLVTWDARGGSKKDNASPEELTASAQASCFSMALSSVLEEPGKIPEKMNVGTCCILDEADGSTFRITTMAVEVWGRVPGMDPEEFRSAVEWADRICLMTNALRENVDIRVNSVLEEAT